MLSVALLKITESADELFTGYVFVVCEEVSLSGLSGVVDQDVRIGSHTGHGADHVAGFVSYEIGRIWWSEELTRSRCRASLQMCPAPAASM